MRSLLAAAILALAGCATLSGAPVEDSNLEFELQGRAALRYGAEGGNTRITWRHAVTTDDLLITGPLGQGIARITRRDGDARLTTADGKEYRAGDAETLTESVLGWRLPLAGLPDWVRGRPSTGRPVQSQRDDSGRIASMQQDGWGIEYLAWEGEMPSRLTLKRDAMDGKVAIEIRLVIDQWKAGS